MSDLIHALQTLQTRNKDDAVMVGVPDFVAGRSMTGVFPFDLASGGGFPRGKVSIVYGPESSLKTTLCLKAIAHCQATEPDKKCVFVDVEGHYDPLWAGALGVDNTKLIKVLPNCAEETIDYIIAAIAADDLGVMVIDSLAAMAPANEIASSTEKASVGGTGLLIGKFYRKAGVALAKQAKRTLYPTVIAINQIRYKIGVMYGNPETMPGGQAWKYGSSLTTRVYAKDEIDKELSTDLPAWKICTGSINKFKVPIISKGFMFKLATVNVPSKGVILGSVYDWNTVLAYLKNFELLEKVKTGYKLEDTVYPTQKDLRTLYYKDTEFNTRIKQTIIDLALEGEDG